MSKKRAISMILVIALVLTFVGFISAAIISDDLHLNIQTTFSNGSIQTGTFDFAFNISTASDCSAVIYSNLTSLTTDVRGIISYYLPNVSLDYDEKYYLCYYRDGTLEDAAQITRTPYTFRARNVTTSGIEADANLDMSSYNITTGGTGFFGWLGDLATRVTKLFVIDVDFNGTINGTGNITTTGYMGVGTTTPSQRLDVEGAIQIGNTTSAEAGVIRWTGSQFEAYNGTTWNTFSTGVSSLWTQSGSDIYYNAGSVGIGTATPQQTFNVVGTANFTDNVTFGTVSGQYLAGNLAGSGAILNRQTTSTDPTLVPSKDQFGYGIGYGSQSLHLIAGDTNVVEVYDSFVNFIKNITAQGNVTATAAGSWGLFNKQSTSTIPSIVPNKDQLGYGLGYGSSSLHLIADDTNVLEVEPSLITAWTPTNFTDNVTFGSVDGHFLSGNLATSAALLNEPTSSTNPTLIPNKAALGYGIGYGVSSLHLIANDENVVEVTDSEVTFNENVSMTKNLSVMGNVGIGTSSPEGMIHVQASGAADADLVFDGGTGANAGMILRADTDSKIPKIDFRDRDTPTSTLALMFLERSTPITTGASQNELVIDSDNEIHLSTGLISRMTVDNAGNVGINTSTPQNTLNVVGDGNFTGNFSVNNNGLFVDTSTNRVGIGTATPNKEIHIFKDASTSVGIRMENKDTTNGGVLIGFDNGEDMLLYNYGIRGINFGTRGLERMRIDSVGNVGIGTASPAQLGGDGGRVLSVTAPSSGNDNPEIVLNRTVAATQATASMRISDQEDLIFAVKDGGAASINALTILSDTGTANFIDDVNVDDNFTVDSSVLFVNSNIDRVGIGTTNPQNPLNVVGDGNFTGNLYSNGNLLGVGTVGGTGTYGYIPMWNDTDSLNNSAIYQNGTNIGIGTTSPSAKFEVEGTGQLHKLEATSSAEIYTTWEQNDGDVMNIGVSTDANAYSFINSANNPLRFYTGGHHEMTLTTTGLGIGTTTPQTALNIIDDDNLGGINITGDGANTGLTLTATGSGGTSYKIMTSSGGHGDGDGKLLFLDSSNLARMVLDGSDVGIGTTTPQQPLNVIGDGNFTTGAANTASILLDVGNAGSPQFSISDNTGDNFWAIGADDTENSFKIKGSASSMPTINSLTTPFFEITTAGYVGINTGDAGPSSLLQITQDQANMAANIPLVNLSTVGTAANTKGAVLHLSSTRGTGTDDTDLFKVEGGSSGLNTYLTVRNTGLVGIGTTTPQNTLNVVGGGNFTGTVYANEQALLSTSGTAAKAYGLDVEDTRAAERLPSEMPDKQISAEFTDELPGLGAWYSLINVKGWTDGYASWQLIGGSTTTTNEELYFRSGKDSTWNTLREVWHEGSDGSGSGLDADLLDTYDTSASGNRFGVIPFVAGDGVTEIGKYLDFHDTDGDTSDNDGRITSASGALSTSGNFGVAGNLDVNGYIYDSGSNLVLADTVDIGSASTGLRVGTNGYILDIDGSIVLNDNTYIGSTGNGIVVSTDGYIYDVDDASVYINDDLTVAGGDGAFGTTSLAEQATLGVYASDSYISLIEARGGSQGTGMVYVGQSTTHGGGITYDGDGTPASVGTTDHFSIFRRTSSADTEVLHWLHTSSQAEFEGNIDLNSNQLVGASQITFSDSSNHRIDSAADGLLFDGGDGTWDFLIYDNVIYSDVLRLGYTGDAEIITYDTNEDLTIDPAGTGDIIMVPDSGDGNVGIGEISPEFKLDVVGNISLIDLLYFDGVQRKGDTGYGTPNQADIKQEVWIDTEAVENPCVWSDPTCAPGTTNYPAETCGGYGDTSTIINSDTDIIDYETCSDYNGDEFGCQGVIDEYLVRHTYCVGWTATSD